MGFWNDLNNGLKSNPVTRVFSMAGEAVYNVLPKNESGEIATPQPSDVIPGWDENKSASENIAGGIVDNTLEKIPGWDENKSASENIAGGVKVVTDAFGNAAKAATELGSSVFDGVKKYAPLALAGGLAVLLLSKK